MKITSAVISIALVTRLASPVLGQNTSPLPAGDTEIGGHLHAGQSNEVWTDATSLYFNYRGNATATYFWNGGNSTGRSIMSLLNNGNVGIGTDSPAYSLDVNGTIRSYRNLSTTGIINGTGYFGDDGSGNTIFSITRQPNNETRFQSYGYHTFYSGSSTGSERMRIDASGNVGIGTNSPAYSLDVNGTIRSYRNLGTTGIINGTGYFGDDGSGNTIFSITRQPNNETRFQSYGYHTFYSGSSTGSERMRIDASGNVGIGSSSPLYKLQVSAADASVQQRFERTGSSVGVADIGVDTQGFKFFVGGYGSTTMKVLLGSNGRMGIGTFSPDATLTVNGNIHTTEVKVDLSIPGPDYVFEKDYKLTSLEDIKTYIDQNKHLPEVPSAKEMEKNGVQLGEMNMLLLKKIEEITLHMIEQQREIKELKEEVKNLKSK